MNKACFIFPSMSSLTKSRRKPFFKVAVTLSILCVAFCTRSYAALDLELTQGINSARPIAIVPFKGQAAFDTQLSQVIAKDLKNSGRFKLLDFDKSKHHPMTLADIDFNYWRTLGADNVIVGSIVSLNDTALAVNFQLLDSVGNAHLLLTKKFKIKPGDMRSLAHHISDLVYQKLTGERGVFSTRIAYVVVKRGSGQKTQYALEVADADGGNPQALLQSTQPIMSPAWSPNGKKIAYVSFERKRSQIYVVNVETGQRQLVSSFSGINGAPAWSPDGKQMAVVLSKSGKPKLYLVTLATGAMKQLTHGLSIDTEPSFSPDGKYILFTSGRGGSPQIYRLTLATGSVTRMTFDGNYNATASYSSDRQNIVMLHRDDAGFNIALQSLKGGAVTTLTYSGKDESPTVSPNGQMVLYATRHAGRGVLSIVSTDGKVRLRLPARNGDVQEPAWAPFIG